MNKTEKEKNSLENTDDFIFLLFIFAYLFAE